MPLPNALYIGMPRCGSTWLFKHLRTHPDVFAPAAKDLYFFDRYYERGIDWYARQFEEGANSATRIEFSHDYLFSPIACRRVAADLDRPRLVVGLRDPITYLRSTRGNLIRNGTTRAQLERVGESGRLIAGSLVADFVADWLAHHPRDSFMFFRYDELAGSPTDVYRRILAHLRLAELVPEAISERVNVARAPRSTYVARATKSSAGVARRLGLASTVGRVKASGFVTGALYGTSTTTTNGSDNDLERALRELARPAVERLGQLIGQDDLAAVWGYE